MLPNGKVLVIGGWGSTGLSSSEVELYDTTGNTSIVGPLPGTTHVNHTATRLPNGKVLVVGGTTSDLPSFTSELYDPATNTWTTGGTIVQTRGSHLATLLSNGNVLVSGGFGSSAQKPGTEIYHPTTNTWTAVESPSAMRGGTSTLLSNGKILLIPWVPVAAPSATELYDPVSNAWSLTAPITTSNTNHTATLLPNGTILMVGGGDYSVKSGSSFGSDVGRLFDPAGNTWSQADKLILGPRTGHTATLLLNGYILVVGGAESTATGARAEAALFGPL